MPVTAEAQKNKSEIILDRLNQSAEISIAGMQKVEGKFNVAHLACPYLFEVAIYVAPKTPVLSREELAALARRMEDQIIKMPGGQIECGSRDNGRFLGIPSVSYEETLGTFHTESTTIFSDKRTLDNVRRIVESANPPLGGVEFMGDGRLIEIHYGKLISTTRVIIYPSIAVAEVKRGYESVHVNDIAELLPAFDLKSLRHDA